MGVSETMTDRASTPPVAPGDVLAGKYRVERVLGAGGMGVVVQATHLELDERVAMKFLLPHAVESAEAATRFVREARAAVKIKSEHVARVTDVGRLDNGSPYIVMEFLQGSDLSAVVQRGPLPIEDAVDFVIQASDAMAEAHAAGIVHRDLKPSNLFLSMRSDGSPIIKVLDFGISKVNVPDTSDAGLTRTTTIMGSPFYMSPEQMRSSKDVDHRTDIWALGVILFELLSGTQPFNGETLPQLVAAILAEPPLSLRTHRPDVPPDLEAVVLHCLEKDRDKRFQSVGAMAQALVNFGSRRSRHTAERIIRLSGLDMPGSGTSMQRGLHTSSGSDLAGTGGSSVATGARTNTAWTDTKGGAPQGRTTALVLGGLGVLAVLGGAAAFMLRGSGQAASEASASASAPATPVAIAPVAAAPPEIAPIVPTPAEPTPPAPVSAPTGKSPSPSARPSAARSSTPRPSAAPNAAPTPAPAPAPAPTPRSKNPLAIDLK
jgi:eukaryotic-like serine/threonine-protein kinase